MKGAKDVGGGIGCVEDVLITPQLIIRSSRAPDHAAENRAFAALAQEMAVNPGGVLQKCALLAMELCRADSAGISILEPGETGGIFRWHSTVGAFAGNFNGTIPQEASPCGVVIARDSVLLFEQAERFFPALHGLEPRIHENLLAPWHMNGEAKGTLWVMKHTSEGRFDGEDARILVSLGRFASAAHQMNVALAEAERARKQLEGHVGERTRELVHANERLRESEAHLAADLAGMRRLYDLHAKLANQSDLGAALGEIVGAAAEFTGTDRGCVQLVSDDGERLEMFAHHGYAAGSGFIKQFLRQGSKPACDAARQSGQRLVIEDVETFPGLAGTRDREVALADGIRATQSTPMISRTGELVGVLSTQFPQPHRSTEHELRLIDLLAWSGADFVARHRADAALRMSEGRLAADLAAMHELQSISTELVGAHDPAALYGRIVGAAAALMGSDAASMQELHVETGRLKLLAWHGFHPESAAFWEWVQADTGSSCGRALMVGDRIVVANMDQFDGEPEDVEAYRRSGLLSVQSSPLRAHSGRIVGMLSTHWRDRRAPAEDEFRFFDVLARLAADLIERLQASERLRESEERFRQFGEASSDVLWIRDAERLQWEYLSPAFEAVYGIPREDALGANNLRNWADLIVAEDRERALACIARVREGERVRFEYRVRRPDGEIRWLRDTDFPMRGHDGAVERIGGVGHDVTELKRIEAALREEEARQRALVEGIPQLVWRSAAAGRWNWSGRQWTAYTGLSDTASRDLGWLDVVHPEDREGAVAAWARATEAGDLFEADYRLRSAADNAWRWFQSRGVPVRREDGRIAEWICTATDIDDQMQARAVLTRSREELEARVAERTTELMAAEGHLRQAQKMEAVGQLTGGIAHDFNNMLQGVTGGLDMARRRMKAGRLDEAAHYLDVGREATGRAAGLTRRLLAFARRQRLEPKPIDADGLIAGLVDLIRRTVGPHIELKLGLRDGSVSVVCDPNELESALLNLCINARDAMPEGGRLAIGTEEARLSAADIRDCDATPGRYVAISIADTGTGMPPEVLERVFEPFFTTKPQGQGTGLGLSQFYGFVRQSGGLVRIKSTPGRGTTVRLLLPLHEGAAAAKEPAPLPSPLTNASGTVLLVDDEDAVRRPAADQLRDLGLTVLEARDGPEALRVLATARPDLLVTDVGLPNGMNGRQVAEAARERIPGLLVLFITGHAGGQLPPGSEVMGKPFGLDILARRVQALLAMGRNEQAADAEPQTWESVSHELLSSTRQLSLR